MDGVIRQINGMVDFNSYFGQPLCNLRYCQTSQVVVFVNVSYHNNSLGLFMLRLFW